jgi:ATP-dependent Lon protease
MTGEITLRGKVLPVGEFEKNSGGKRAKYTDIILPAANQHDLKEIEPYYIEGLNLHFVDDMNTALELSLLPQKVKEPLDLSAVK